MSHNRVLIVGGYGGFGARLVLLLARTGVAAPIVAGRSLDKARALAERHGCEAARFDRDGDVGAQLLAIKPAIVVDASGPFQTYGRDPYRLARAALAAGAHYLDLADDADFAAGIAALDGAARMAGCAAISGASTAPAISSAAVAELARGLERIALIDTVILPGTVALRGRALAIATLSQVGRPLRIWRDGAWTEARGWSVPRREDITVPGAAPLVRRWSALMGVPDLVLFPRRFGADSVVFRAGLELSPLQFGLHLLGWLAAKGLVRDPKRWARALQMLGSLLIPLGDDRGGMRVAVTGRDAAGMPVRRSWSLVAERGEGPFVPALPACLLVEKLLRGEGTPGARPCVDELTLAEVERGLTRIGARTGRGEEPAPSLFARVLGREGKALPAPIRALHEVHDRRTYAGEASVEDGASLLARLARRIMRLPPPAARVPVRVAIERRGGTERWTRRFGAHRFHSVLSIPRDAAPRRVNERFGPIGFRIRLEPSADGLGYAMEGMRAFGIPLPHALAPVSDTVERVDAQGRFTFDVDIALPLVGRIVRYRGWLTEER